METLNSSAVIVSETISKKINAGVKNMSAYLTKLEINNAITDLNKDQTIEQSLTINGKTETSKVKLPSYNIIEGIHHDTNGAEFKFKITMSPIDGRSVTTTLNDSISFNCNENSQLKTLITGYIVPELQQNEPETQQTEPETKKSKKHIQPVE